MDKEATKCPLRITEGTVLRKDETPPCDAGSSDEKLKIDCWFYLHAGYSDREKNS